MKHKSNIIKKKRSLLFIILIGLVLGLIVVGVGFYSTKAKASHKVTATPTLFLHGWGSSVNAEHQMTREISKRHVSSSVTQAYVNGQGKVKLKGRIPVNAKNPLIEVGFAKSRTSYYPQNGQWLKNVLLKLQQTYQIKKVNLVGHSMGNMAIMHYLLNAPDNLPQINKIVDIAGHFNGIIGLNDKPHQRQLDVNGKPDYMNPEYRQLLPLRKTFPPKTQVLNIYGDKNDGSNSDGSVTAASAKSLRYLVSERAASYQEKKISGYQGRHSRLHESLKVDQLLIKYLWPKNKATMPK